MSKMKIDSLRVSEVIWPDSNEEKIDERRIYYLGGIHPPDEY